MPLRRCRVAMARPPAALPFSAEAFAAIAPAARLRERLTAHAAAPTGPAGPSRAIISRSVFQKYCSECDVKDPDKTLRLLEKTGTVVLIDGGERVHLRPAQYIHMYDDAVSGKVSSKFFLDEVEKRIEAANAEALSMREALVPALRKASKWRRRVWGGALCFAGAQLALISRLTFFDFDWDIMEPVSYFLGTGTSIVFFLYFMRYGRSLTYTDFDKTMLPPKVKKYSPPDFDWQKYNEICQKIESEETMARKIREWVQRH